MMSIWHTLNRTMKKCNEMMETMYRRRCEVNGKVLQKFNTESNERSPQRHDQPTSRTIHVKPLDAPKFSGVMREFPTFMKDYIH